MAPLFFVHIPKTAGTSFRKSAESYFGSDKVLCDYSPDSPDTSELVNDLIYKDNNPFIFREICHEQSIRFLSGHVPAIKFVHLFGSGQTVTFLRDPFQRLMSEYHHFVRHYGYKGDFPSFYRKPSFVNRMFKILHHVPLESIGFLGLTEDYETSLDILNDRYSTEIECTAMNMGRENKEKDYEIPKDQLNELHALNQNDLKLYQEVVKIFNERKRFFNDELPFVHGKIQLLNKESVHGWAWYANENTPVEIDILSNGKKVGTVKAIDLRPALLQFSPPRGGYVGFRLNFPKSVPAGTSVSAVVTKTGQVLGETQLTDLD